MTTIGRQLPSAAPANSAVRRRFQMQQKPIASLPQPLKPKRRCDLPRSIVRHPRPNCSDCRRPTLPFFGRRTSSERRRQECGTLLLTSRDDCRMTTAFSHQSSSITCRTEEPPACARTVRRDIPFSTPKAAGGMHGSISSTRRRGIRYGLLLRAAAATPNTGCSGGRQQRLPSTAPPEGTAWLRAS